MAEAIPYTNIMERVKEDIDYIAEQAYQKGYALGAYEHEMRWIPITEEMPDADEEVLVTREYKGKRYVEVACLLYGEWLSYSDEYKVGFRRDHKVLAWMPKPKPYTQE